MSKKKENHFESVEEEVKFLRRQNAGMRGQISVLQKQVKKYKLLDLEGDRLYEEKIAECGWLEKELESANSVRNDSVPTTRFAELKQEIDIKNAFIETLQERVQSLMVEKSELESKVASLDDERTELYYTIEELRKPWWRKMF